MTDRNPIGEPVGTGPVRVLVCAPFERGRGQGGSQRATAIAERLEERGVEVGWLDVPRRELGTAGKLVALARGRPVLSALYADAEPPDGEWDLALVAHSYLVPSLSAGLGPLPTAVDFHNLEWRHLDDAAPRSRTGVRAAWTAVQVRLTRRSERAILRCAPLSLLVSDEERAWATTAEPAAATALVPSVLPRADERLAAAIAAARAPRAGCLAYVGTLTFPTNVASLDRFLETAWPAMRAARPELRLLVAGAAEPADRARFAAHPGVDPLGFVADLSELLARCEAVVMPFRGRAGTSLRALLFALAGLPVIGSADAFRGLPFAVGEVAEHPADWARAVETIAHAPVPNAPAWAWQRDPAPWDALVASLTRLRPDATAVGHDRSGAVP